MERAGNPVNTLILDASCDNPLSKRSRLAKRGLTVGLISPLQVREPLSDAPMPPNSSSISSQVFRAMKKVAWPTWGRLPS
jgi:hypothetical protein